MAGQQLAIQCHPLFWMFEAVHVYSTFVCQVVDDSEQAVGICIERVSYFTEVIVLHTSGLCLRFISPCIVLGVYFFCLVGFLRVTLRALAYQH